MSERICIILNPAAKGERAQKLQSRVRELMPEAAFKLTSRPGDAEALAERAVQQGYTTVVAAGGDGTLNEVVNGLAGSHVNLGVLPIGTINVFALDLGIPTKIEDAIAVIRKGKVLKIDLALANDQYFIQLAGIGLDAQIVQKTDWQSKKTFGPLSYLFTLSQLAGAKPPRLIALDANGNEHVGNFILVGNGRFYGGPFKIFTQSSINDGLLDICVFKKMSPIDLVRYFQGVMTGSHTKFPDVEYFQCANLTVSSEESIPVEVDGELYGTTPVTFSVKTRAMSVLVP